MADERYTFTQARTRLEDIVVQVRKKDCTLEQSLELLEEGVRLANVCTELSDHTEWVGAEATIEAGASEPVPDDAVTGGDVVAMAGGDDDAAEADRGSDSEDDEA